MKMKNFITLTLAILLVAGAEQVKAQYGEPELQGIQEPKNLYDEGFRSGFGFSFNLNDFGFGVGMQFRKGLSSYTEGLVNLKISGLRDPSEQTFIDYYFGSKTIPSKYKRVITFPATIGVKRRVFAQAINDNFRVHTSMSFGPTLAITYPYFKDQNGNGFRESNLFEYSSFEPVLDIFQGWDQSETLWGWTGDLVLGIDFGDNFAKLQTFQFGYSFYYFDSGIQIMEPFQPGRDALGNIIRNPDGTVDQDAFEKSYDASKYFGSAQITFVFGWMW